MLGFTRKLLLSVSVAFSNTRLYLRKAFPKSLTLEVQWTCTYVRSERGILRS